MKITLSNAAPATLKSAVLVVGAFADGTLLPAAQAVDQAAGGKLRRTVSTCVEPEGQDVECLWSQSTLRE